MMILFWNDWDFNWCCDRRAWDVVDVKSAAELIVNNTQWSVQPVGHSKQDMHIDVCHTEFERNNVSFHH